MKRNVLLLLIMFISLSVNGQEMPSVKIGKDKLGITSLDVKVEIIGNIATTTYDMQFYNPMGTTLEGELNFPLGEGQRVSRLALDVNGKLREAVVVEKEQGRVAFEAVVRRRVDPILLEKGTGNNYKARIYPIFPRSHKRVVLAYEQELIVSEGAHYFQLPLGFKKNLDNFSISMNIYDQADAPEVMNGEDFKFTSLENSYSAQWSKENYTPSESITIKIPQTSNVAKVITYEDYFYGYSTLQATKRFKKKAEKITLLYDSSLSMKDRLMDKELALLDAYFKHVGDLKVDLITFSNVVINEQSFTIKNGDWDALRTALINSVFDGATSYSSLPKISNSDEIFLMTDGMRNLSDLSINTSVPITVINSLIKANHIELNQLSSTSNGKYINLKAQTVNEALSELTTETLQFLGFTSNNKDLTVYPKAPVSVSNDFSVAAKGTNDGDVVTLQFGYNNKVEFEKTLSINTTVSNKLVKRLWAQKKLDDLQEFSTDNRDAIVKHAKTHQLVSDHTSLIVLETAWDYYKYQIIPPSELLDEYNAYAQRYNNKMVKAISEDLTEVEEKEDGDVLQESNTTQNNSTNAIVTGVVTDETGPLPGVNVLIKGTTTGTQTDFDGEYRISVKPGDELVYSFVGYQSLETTVNRSGRINIAMEEEMTQLDEVIVTAQGIKREKKAIGYAVSEIENESIQQRTEGDVARVISGKASGVNITNQSGTSGSATNVIIRGYNSINGSNQPLFIVDGVPFSNDTNSQGDFLTGNVGSSRLLDLDPNNIESVRVLKGLAAATLYGTQGRNGVVIITTKSGFSGQSATNRGYYYSNPNIKVKKYIVDNPWSRKSYIRALKKTDNIEHAYKIYLEERESHMNEIAFYVDVYDYFRKWSGQKIGQRILSNIIELDPDNYEVLRAYAYKLEEMNDLRSAEFIYKRVLELRPEDTQSYRDLALVQRDLGMISNSYELLESIVSGEIYKGTKRRRIYGLEDVVRNDLASLLVTDNDIDLNRTKSLKIKNGKYDVRIIIDWNHNDTNIDLNVVDPNYEVASQSNRKTRINGRLSQNNASGFGPEEYTLKRAKKGNYYIELKYKSDFYQKVDTPTFIKITMFKNYGKENESKEIKVVRLLKQRDKMIAAKLII